MKRNGKKDGKQTYNCKACEHQFRSGEVLTGKEVWTLYQANKQTVGELATLNGKSPSTIKRRLREVSVSWRHPDHERIDGYVHFDLTYWCCNQTE